MSYILDALRKAEMERELSRVPGISSRQHFARAVARFPAKLWLVVAFALVLGMAIGWLWLRPDTAHENKLAAAASLRTAAAPEAAHRVQAPRAINRAPAALAVAEPLQQAPVARSPYTAAVSPAASVPVAVAQPQSMPLPAAKVATAQPAVAVPGTVQSPPAQQMQAAYREEAPPNGVVAMIAAEAERGWPAKQAPQPAKPDEPAMQVQPADSPDQSSATEEELPPLLSTLPYRFQSTLPKIVINAQAYAEETTARFVIINMKKYREGEHTDEGVVVESIGKEYLVLSYQGQAFRMQR